MVEVIVDGIGYMNLNSSDVVDLDSSAAKGLLVCSTITAAGIGSV